MHKQYTRSFNPVKNYAHSYLGNKDEELADWLWRETSHIKNKPTNCNFGVVRKKRENPHPNTEDSKWCIYCQTYKIFEDFCKKAMSNDGLASTCRACDVIKRKIKKEKDQEKQMAL